MEALFIKELRPSLNTQETPVPLLLYNGYPRMPFYLYYLLIYANVFIFYLSVLILKIKNKKQSENIITEAVRSLFRVKKEDKACYGIFWARRRTLLETSENR